MAAATITPVRKTITVNRAPEDAFRIFTEELGSWWPLATHAVDPARAHSVRVDDHVGGVVAEVWDDGTEHAWGEILTWEPPARFAMTWGPGRPERPTEVHVTFTADGEATRVELEHRGWENYGEQADAMREQYDSGWPGVLGEFARATV